jgi:hypothetical protein
MQQPFQGGIIDQKVGKRGRDKDAIPRGKAARINGGRISAPTNQHQPHIASRRSSFVHEHLRLFDQPVSFSNPWSHHEEPPVCSTTVVLCSGGGFPRLQYQGWKSNSSNLLHVTSPQNARTLIVLTLESLLSALLGSCGYFQYKDPLSLRPDTNLDWPRFGHGRLHYNTWSRGDRWTGQSPIKEETEDRPCCLSPDHLCYEVSDCRAAD